MVNSVLGLLHKKNNEFFRNKFYLNGACRMIVCSIYVITISKKTVVFCHFGYFFGHFWQKNTPNFPAQYRIDHLSIENKSDTVCTVNFVATFHVLTRCYSIDSLDCKKSQVVSILHNEFRKKENKNEKMIISSFLGPPNK